MVIVVLVVTSLVVAVVAGVAARRWPAADPAAEAGDTVGRARRERPRDGFLRTRLDPDSLTGLALTVASTIVVLGSVVVGILFYLIRAKAHVLDVDAAVADWAATQATDLSTTMLRAITQLGSTPTVVAVTLVVGVAEFRRRPNRSLWVFLTLIVAGELIIVNLVKFGVARARPSIDPLAPFSGSSFPSGHTATAAACYAALALVLSRGRTPTVRATLAGVAAGIAVAVGASRMLLGVHWFTDVVAGLAIGWAWFALCAIATGGQFLRFGAPAEPGLAEPVGEQVGASGRRRLRQARS